MKMTTRELEIVAMLIEGHGPADIAEKFGTSKKTVSNQLWTLLRKRGAKNLAHLVSMEHKARMPQRDNSDLPLPVGRKP